MKRESSEGMWNYVNMHLVFWMCVWSDWCVKTCVRGEKTRSFHTTSAAPSGTN